MRIPGIMCNEKKEEDDFNRAAGFPAKASPFSVGTAPG
jgi:hypothetical protein